MSQGQIAIETSCRQGSIALLEQDVLIEQIILPQEQRTAQSISTALERLLQKARSEEVTLGWISVSIGPGSFTGLRIGVTAAKTLAYALNLQVAPCDTLEAAIMPIRADFPEKHGFDFAMNAYRGQVFWRREGPNGQVLHPTQVVDRAHWLSQLTDSEFISSGDAWKQLNANSVDLNTICVGCAPDNYWIPKAEHIGILGWKQKQAGTLKSPFEVMPNYLRASAAEEKIDQKK